MNQSKDCLKVYCLGLPGNRPALSEAGDAATTRSFRLRPHWNVIRDGFLRSRTIWPWIDSTTLLTSRILLLYRLSFF